jgi:hypothetical protein
LFKLSAFSFLALILSAPQIFAAACCGGGFALPSIITGDDKAQVTTTYSYSNLDTRVLSNGVWRKQKDQDLTQVLRLEGAHIFKDRYQAGFSVPLLMKSQGGLAGGEASGLGDSQALVGYEFLPDWDYNPWRPKGIGFLTLVAPSGSSQYDSDTLYTNRGRGFWSLGAGTILTKYWIKWDVLSTFEIHRRFSKSVSNENFQGEVTPGWGHSFSVGGGYNLQNLRLGTSLSWNTEDAISDGGQNIYTFYKERYATLALLASYTFAQNWAGTLSYADQTLLGDPTNTTLSKTVSLILQKRWSR